MMDDRYDSLFGESSDEGDDLDLDEALDLWRPRDPYAPGGPFATTTRQEREDERERLLEGRSGPAHGRDLDEALTSAVHGTEYRPREADLEESTTSQTETFQEQTTSFREASISGHTIRHVAILSARSRNGRRYSPQALQDVAEQISEGDARVFLDHAEGRGSRSVRDLVGVLSSARVVGGRVTGSLRLLDTAHREQIKDLVREDVDGVGLSISARGEVEPSDGESVVREVTELRSVDVVIDPATVSSFSESENAGRFSVSAEEVKEFHRELFG